MSKYCTKCGKELPDSAAFCDNCGNSMQEVTSGNEYRQQNNGQGYAQNNVPGQAYVSPDKPQKAGSKLPLIIGIIGAAFAAYVIISLVIGNRMRGSYEDMWSDLQDRGYVTIEEK